MNLFEDHYPENEPKDRIRSRIDEHSSYWFLFMDEAIRKTIIDGIKREQFYMYHRFPIKITIELG